MKQIIGLDENKICFIMDNSPIHCSIKVKECLKGRKWSCIFLPPYAPELAPVELFFAILKKKILARRTNEVINLEKDNGREVIGEITGSIERVTIIKIWSNFISKLHQIVKEWDSILDLNT